MKAKVLLCLLLLTATVIIGCKAPMKKVVKPPYDKQLLPGSIGAA